jgi:hypothetical protein
MVSKGYKTYNTGVLELHEETTVSFSLTEYMSLKNIRSICEKQSHNELTVTGRSSTYLWVAHQKSVTYIKVTYIQEFCDIRTRLERSILWSTLTCQKCSLCHIMDIDISVATKEIINATTILKVTMVC